MTTPASTSPAAQLISQFTENFNSINEALRINEYPRSAYMLCALADGECFFLRRIGEGLGMMGNSLNGYKTTKAAATEIDSKWNAKPQVTEDLKVQVVHWREGFQMDLERCRYMISILEKATA